MAERPKIVIFTDGACSPNPGAGGWAAILFSVTHAQEKVLTGAVPDTTNNRMELLAAVESLAALKQPSDVTIHTDSQYVSNAFNLGWLKKWQANNWNRNSNEEGRIKPVKNDDLWKRLLELTKVHQVQWSWVRGHDENEMNERCDKLAVEARLSIQK